MAKHDFKPLSLLAKLTLEEVVMLNAEPQLESTGSSHYSKFETLGIQRITSGFREGYMSRKPEEGHQNTSKDT